jgi:NAD(P)-dependent dehydrogenase (short-subunit alcohol dehydrogenase family)
MRKGFYRELFDLTDRVVVITGGAGILGRRFAAGMADHGASIAVIDIDKSGAHELATDLADTYGVRAVAISADISDPTVTRSLPQQVESALGKVDVLFNNAATKGSSLDAMFAPLAEYELSTWREIMATNLDAMFLMAQAFGPGMALRGHGSIIQTASIYGIMGPDQRIYEGSAYLGRAINTPAIYSASKAGVIGLTQYLATYWGHAGVRVNAVTPGGVESGQNEEFQQRYSARIPLGRMARADELVGAAVFLASDASSYITGQNIIVDGGLSAW